jgi:transposase
MNCPKCNKNENCKNGIVRGKQRYKCKICGCNYTQPHKPGYGISIKRQSLHLYLEGLGFRAISRLLNVSNVSVLNWIRAFGEQVKNLKSPVPGEILEIDEMHSYIGSKKTAAGSGLLLIEPVKKSLNFNWAIVPQKLERNFGINYEQQKQNIS